MDHWIIFIFIKKSGSHLLFHTVSSAVSSAAYGLTVVFGMGTGVSRKRITTGHLLSLGNSTVKHFILSLYFLPLC